MSLLVFESHDFELRRTWLIGGVDWQSHTGLIFRHAISRGSTVDPKLKLSV